jgi:protease-4
VKGALEKAGLDAEVVARGEYKSAGEQLVRDKMSEQQREQLESIHDVLYAQVLLALGEGRKLDRARAQAAIDGAPYRAKEAVDAGLVDGAAYEDELAAHLAALAGFPKAAPAIDTQSIDERLASDPSLNDAKLLQVRDQLRRLLHQAPRATVVPYKRYLARMRAVKMPALRRRPVIGVIPVHGPIASEGPFDFGSATDEKLISQIRLARLDDRIEGIILHVDSPGGSALASDRIHHELQELAKEKPLVACLANVAASGGYYIAAPCHAIVAQPTTITGSIGVVATRLVIAPLLQRLGVVTEVVQRGARAGMLDMSNALTEDQRAAVERELEGTYRAFIDVVAAGRRVPKESIEKVAQGRVWTGAEAASKRLVDTLGGFDKALETTRTLIGYDRAAKFAPVVVRAPRRSQAPLTPAPALAPAAAMFTSIARTVGVDPRTLVFTSMRERVLTWSPLASWFD